MKREEGRYYIKPMRMLFSFALFFLFAAPAFGFHLKEHTLITVRALKELERCLEAPLPKALSRRLVRANLAEDLNLFRKWSRFSHYFHPHQELPLRRYDASVRIERLSEKLNEALQAPSPRWEKIFALLGHGVHHIQDMASPSHVVPVSHGLFDGFEALHHASFFASPLGSLDCAALAAQSPPALAHALRETALATLSALTRELTLSRDGREERLFWSAFWQPAKGEPYGSYGALGNHFGESSFTHKGHSYHVPQEAYYLWKEAQLQLAVEVTCRVLYPFLIRWRAHAGVGSF